MLLNKRNHSLSSRRTEKTGLNNQDEPFRLELRNISGVPVVEVFGDLNRAAVRKIESTAAQLVRAGHYNLVLNIQKAAAVNVRSLLTLSNLVREVKRHYGGVLLVTRLEQVGSQLSDPLRGLFSMCLSEAEALWKIKPVSHYTDWEQSAVGARLAE